MSTSIDPQILLFAEVALGKDYNEFAHLFNEYLESDYYDFLVRYPYRPAFEETYETNSEQFFIDFAQQRGRFAWVDWSGEENEGDVADIVNRMLQRHWNTRFEWDTPKFNETINFDTLERGEYILLLFKAIDAKLQKQGFRVIHFQTGSDAYHYSVLPVKSAEKIIGLRWGLCYCVYSPDKIPTAIPYFSYFFHSLRETFWRSLFPVFRLLKKRP